MYSPITCQTCGKPLKRQFPAQKYHKGRCTDAARQKAIIKHRNKNKQI